MSDGLPRKYYPLSAVMEGKRVNPALEALLKRIEAAGGPIREGWNTDKPVWDAVFSEADKYGYTTFTIGPKDDPRVGPESDALLIHALKTDAQRRGWTWEARWHKKFRVHLWSPTIEDWNGDWEIRPGEGDSEAVAWCLAWLSAFEQEPA